MSQIMLPIATVFSICLHALNEIESSRLAAFERRQSNIIGSTELFQISAYFNVYQRPQNSTFSVFVRSALPLPPICGASVQTSRFTAAASASVSTNVARMTLNVVSPTTAKCAVKLQ